jgi:2-polyprenyl-3-methyl-5-hydroxy-6-metoxy-1,4-benzoquinol methylase
MNLGSEITLEYADLQLALEESLAPIFRAVGLRAVDAQTVVYSIDQANYRQQVQEFAKTIDQQAANALLSARTEFLYKQIRDHVQGKVLDFGCGNGDIGKHLENDGNEVVFTDIYQDASIPEEKFVKSPDAIKKGYDTTILSCVLHHAKDPQKVIEEVQFLTKNKVIIVEPIYGLDGFNLGHLTKEEQFLGTVAIDNIYGALLHGQIGSTLYDSFQSNERLEEACATIGETLSTQYIFSPEIGPLVHALKVVQVKEKSKSTQDPRKRAIKNISKLFNFPTSAQQCLENFSKDDSVVSVQGNSMNLQGLLGLLKSDGKAPYDVSRLWEALRGRDSEIKAINQREDGIYDCLTINGAKIVKPRVG